MTCMVLVRFVCNSGVFEDMVYLFGVTLWRYIYIYMTGYVVAGHLKLTTEETHKKYKQQYRR